jgi:hypothetical protein
VVAADQDERNRTFLNRDLSGDVAVEEPAGRDKGHPLIFPNRVILKPQTVVRGFSAGDEPEAAIKAVITAAGRTRNIPLTRLSFLFIGDSSPSISGVPVDPLQKSLFSVVQIFEADDIRLYGAAEPDLHHPGG